MANQQLAKYIKENTQKGYTLEQLRKVILDEGYTGEDFDKAAKSIPPMTIHKTIKETRS